MAHPQTILPFGPATPSLDDADDKRARDVAWWAKAILIWLLQVIGVSAAVIFGMFSTLAWQNSEIAKSQADSANLLSMVALCTQLDERDERYQQMCESISMVAQQRLRALAESMFGDLPRPTRTRTFTSSSTSSTSTSESSSTSTESSTSSEFTSSVTSTIEPTSSTIASSLSPTTEFSTSSPTLSLVRTWTTRIEPTPTGPVDMPNVGSDIGVADKIAIAVGATTVFISILSLATLWPVWKKYRRERTRRRGLQGQFSANVGSGPR